MKCQKCNKNEANVQYKEFINGIGREIHLCSECAKDIGLMNHTSDIFRNMEREMLHAFSFPFGGSSLLGGALARSFAGLPETGDFFETDPVEGLETVAPAKENKNTTEAPKPSTIDEMKAKLLDAIADERYEDAARLRDKIKELKGE